ncbi:hypothetical protein [Nonomuraea sp. NPDC052265]|uniref:hypothetical protein n=1 Tax=Nonomuraea sp. NPDC052265 TaxID=3364374 RepID=UPI0037C81638
MAQFDEAARREMADHAATAREASVEIARHMSVLWEARLNMAMAAGDEESVRSVLNEAQAQAYLDNCNCTRPDGGGSYLD